MSEPVSKDIFVKILEKISIKQIVFSLLIWIVLYYLLKPYVDAERLPNIPYISDEYKISIALLIVSICVVFCLTSIFHFILGLINILKMMSYINNLDANEMAVIREFFKGNVNSCSFQLGYDEGVYALIEKGILIPVDKESYRLKRSSSFDFYLHPLARKKLRKVYS
ncbi:TPA: super-infection exclusion protein B [Morganella morganii]